MPKQKFGRLGLFLVGLLGIMSLYSGSALAAGPPIVTVAPASELTLNTAKASGTVDKNGAASASVKIEYGKSKLYGSSVTLTSVTGTGAIPVSQILYGLEPLTTYHYRISSTNSFGTTVSGDMVFEMLLQWKVAGKTLSEYSEPVRYAAKLFAWNLTGEGTTKGGTAVKVTCESSSRKPNGEEDYATGYLGSSLHIPYKNCKTFLNGTESKNCKPLGFTGLDLNGQFQPSTGSSKTLELGELCAIGESLPLPSGYRVGPFGEAKEHDFALSESAGFMTFSIANPTWVLTGFNVGQAFAIS